VRGATGVGVGVGLVGADAGRGHGRGPVARRVVVCAGAGRHGRRGAVVVVGHVVGRRRSVGERHAGGVVWCVW
jgi:hypothetical protein